jgi:hypothetical protein
MSMTDHEMRRVEDRFNSLHSELYSVKREMSNVLCLVISVGTFTFINYLGILVLILR